MADRILFVDDSGVVLRSLNRALSTTFDITTAYSADEAMRLIEDQRFSVVVTDMSMPGGDGLSLINRAFEVTPETRFIVLTGNCDAKTREAIEASGRVFELLTKPCPIEKLEEVINLAIADRAEVVKQ